MELRTDLYLRGLILQPKDPKFLIPHKVCSKTAYNMSRGTMISPPVNFSNVNRVILSIPPIPAFTLGFRTYLMQISDLYILLISVVGNPMKAFGNRFFGDLLEFMNRESCVLTLRKSITHVISL
jgi:hypothetical protein